MVSEVEDYAVDLDAVTALELHIIPDISGGAVPASLAGWYLVMNRLRVARSL
jgi:hypothetical protein